MKSVVVVAAAEETRGRIYTKGTLPITALSGYVDSLRNGNPKCAKLCHQASMHWISLVKHYCLCRKKIKLKMSSFKSNENIHKKEDGSYYVVSANKAHSVTLQ